MSVRPEAIKQLQDEVQKLIDEMTELNAKFDAGACRFHCRTAKENWCAGYVAALNQCEPGSLTPDMTYEEEAKDGWKNRREG